MAAPKWNYVSSEDYLAIERAAKEKHELHQGRVVGMAGASFAHTEIVINVLGNSVNVEEIYENVTF